jgi:hypothetical protein
VVVHCPTAGLLRPAYCIVVDAPSAAIVLCIRGTHSRQDMFTSLTGAVKPHHVAGAGGVALGYAHLGMLAAARWLLAQTSGVLRRLVAEHPGYQLLVVGGWR